MDKKWLLILAAAIAFWFLFLRQPKASWQGELARPDPVQTGDALPAPWKKGNYTISPRARYTLKAVVLSRHRYWASDEDDLSPYDLALGWGPMSLASVINALHITQYGRWYNYTWRNGPPLDPQDIIRHSANNHIIPADRDVLEQIAAIKRFDVVDLRGYLVDVSRPNGWSWHTSLSREDTAGGSCELFWVEQVTRVPGP